MQRNTFNRPGNRFEQMAVAAPVISTIYESSGAPLNPVGDGLTSTDSTPIFEGTAAPGSLVSIWANGVKVGEGYANQFGIFNFEITTPLLAGPQLISARAELNNEFSPSSPLQTVIFWDNNVDPVPPVDPVDPVDLVDPVDPVDPVNPVDPALPPAPFMAPGISSVTDNDGPRRGDLRNGQTTDDATPLLRGYADSNAIVYLFDQGKEIGSVQANIFGNWSYELTTALSNGQHTLTVGVIDSTGTLRISDASFTLSVAAPVPAAITGALNDAGENVGSQTDDNRPTLIGTGAANGTVFILDNGRMLGSATINEKGEWAFTPDAALTTGNHIFYIEVAGPDGSFSGAQAPLELDIVNTAPPVDPVDPIDPVDPVDPVDPIDPIDPVDPIDPAPALSTPVIEGVYDNRNGDEVRIENGLTKDVTPLLKGSADPFAVVGIFDAVNNLVARAEANAQGEWSTELPGLGGNVFYALAMDPENYSNVSERSEPVEIAFDFSRAFTPYSTETLLQEGNELLFPQEEQAVAATQPAEPVAWANTDSVQQDLNETVTW
ncbi:Ig-like domain-containing protein [Duffyella gerundensis]|uniref:Ig-like domain-containing protein n=1 Tax=Duffyella TaxID=3026546 RepID=UPI003F6DFF86